MSIYKYQHEDQRDVLPNMTFAEKKQYIDSRLNERARAELYGEILDAVIDDYDDDPKNCTPIFTIEKRIDKKFEALFEA